MYLSPKQLHLCLKLLNKCPKPQTVNAIMKRLFKDDAILNILDEYPSHRGIQTKKETIDTLDNDSLEAVFHNLKYYDNLKKIVKYSQYDYFYGDSYITTNDVPSDIHGHIDEDLIRSTDPEEGTQPSATPITISDVYRIIDLALYQKTKMTDRQCLEKLLKWIESFSDDDDVSNVTDVLKPYVALVSQQLAKKGKPTSDSEFLNYFEMWAKSMSNNKHPIYVDAMQQFLRPVAYMIAGHLNRPVYFKWKFFS